MCFIHFLSMKSFLPIVFSYSIVNLSSLRRKVDCSCFVVRLSISESLDHFSLLTGIVSENPILADVLGGEQVQAAATFLVVVDRIIFNRRSVTLIIMIFDFTSSFLLVVIVSKVIQLKV